MRPTLLDQIVGQAHLVFPGSPLELLVSGRGANSVLLYGPPGCGKTTIASVVAHQPRPRTTRQPRSRPRLPTSPAQAATPARS
ncbi:AAA family ATPase [Streptomyces sp. NPDC002920]